MAGQYYQQQYQHYQQPSQTYGTYGQYMQQNVFSQNAWQVRETSLVSLAVLLNVEYVSLLTTRAWFCVIYIVDNFL